MGARRLTTAGAAVLLACSSRFPSGTPDASGEGGAADGGGDAVGFGDARPAPGWVAELAVRRLRAQPRHALPARSDDEGRDGRRRVLGVLAGRRTSRSTKRLDHVRARRSTGSIESTSDRDVHASSRRGATRTRSRSSPRARSIRTSKRSSAPRRPVRAHRHARRGAITTVGAIGGGYTSSGDIVSVEGGGTYLTVKGGPNACNDCSIQVDPKTGSFLLEWGPLGHADGVRHRVLGRQRLRRSTRGRDLQDRSSTVSRCRSRASRFRPRRPTCSSTARARRRSRRSSMTPSETVRVGGLARSARRRLAERGAEAALRRRCRRRARARVLVLRRCAVRFVYAMQIDGPPGAPEPAPEFPPAPPA